MCAHCADGGGMKEKCNDPDCHCQGAKPRVKISNWSIWHGSLVGQITGHPRQQDFKAQQQLTSRLLRVDFVKREAETENTIYELL